MAALLSNRTHFYHVDCDLFSSFIKSVLEEVSVGGVPFLPWYVITSTMGDRVVSIYGLVQNALSVHIFYFF